MDSTDFIEVIGAAMIARPIEFHRGAIKITVTTRKKQNCLALSLRIREEVIAALESVGIPRTDIEDVGGSIWHSTWTARKQLTHELRFKTRDMAVVSRAMTSVELVFTNAIGGFLSGISNDFSFTVEEPQYSKSGEGYELALKEAINSANRKASVLAMESGLQFSHVISITELERPRRRSQSKFPDQIEDGLGGRGYDLDESATTFVPVAARKTEGTIQIRIRFAVSRKTGPG